MKTEKKLEQLKNSYLRNEPSEEFLSEGWNVVKMRLGDQEGSKKTSMFYKHGIMFAGVILIMILGSFFGLVKVAQGALPGEPLYSVKRISEEVISVIAKPEIKVENRAQEIIDMVEKQKDQKKLEKTVEEYKENVEKEKEKVSKSEKGKDKLSKKLKKHEEDFEKIINKSDFNEEIEDAIEISRRGRGEDDKGIEEDQEEEKGEVKGDEDEDKEGRD